MDRCNTCKFFSAMREPSRGVPQGWGGCDRWYFGYGLPDDPLQSNELIVEDDEGWGALMGPDFGCVLHQPS